MDNSFRFQCRRISDAGYPASLVANVCSKLLKEGGLDGKQKETDKGQGATVVIPYVHGISHYLKKLARGFALRVVCGGNFKLESLMPSVNNPDGKKECPVNHVSPDVKCAVGVVYSIPLSCGKTYVGQTGRCLVTRLQEHRSNIRGNAGTLMMHSRECGCTGLFKNSEVCARYCNQREREIKEASLIIKLGDNAVSTPSVVLSEKERVFLDV